MFIFPVCELILTEIKLILTDNHCFYHHLCCHVAPMEDFISACSSCQSPPGVLTD